MLKIWGKLVKHNKIVKDEVVALEGGENYQENLKSCILELCRKFDIDRKSVV